MESKKVRRNRITFPLLLGDLLWSCQVASFSERCGLEAFDLSQERIQNWFDSRRPDKRSIVVRELETIIDMVAAQPEEMVSSDEMNQEWTKQAALDFLRELHRQFQGAL